MTPQDLIDDLRSRINPTYAAQLGTESYERRLCAEVLEGLLTEIEQLRQAAVDDADALMIAHMQGYAKAKDEYRKDAERYRFLRNHPEWIGLEHDFRADEIDRQVDDQMAQTHNAQLNATGVSRVEVERHVRAHWDG